MRERLVAGGLEAPLRWSMPVRSASKIKRLDKLAASDNVDFRVSAAGNPMTQQSALDTLMFDPEPRVRGWVARNPKARDNALEWMRQNDTDPSVRAYCAWQLQRRDESGIIIT